MSESGGGHFWYVEALDQMTGAFEGEIEGLVSLAAQNLVLEVTLTHPGVAGVSLIPDVPAERTAEGAWRIRGGRAERMLCGGAEVPSPYIWAGFDSMRVLCRKFNDKPEQASRPMSAIGG